MSQSQYNQTITPTTSAQDVTAPPYYERIIVTNETNVDIYVATNGQPVSSADGGFGAIVLPGTWRMIGNDQPRQPLVSKTAPGSTVQNTGWHGASTPNLNSLASGSPTYVSILASGAPSGGAVGIEFV